MSLPTPTPPLAQALLVEAFFRQSHGNWRSQRRYYTLNNDQTQEVLSFLTVLFLEPGHPDLIHLAQLHHLDPTAALTCGAKTSWNSNYIGPSDKQLSGSTVFGVLDHTLYRDRGFATPNPVTAHFSLPQPNTLLLRTLYNNSTFEEEIKLVNPRLRTRQTIISKAQREIMIGQYLEQKIYP